MGEEDMMDHHGMTDHTDPENVRAGTLRRTLRGSTPLSGWKQMDLSLSRWVYILLLQPECVFVSCILLLPDDGSYSEEWSYPEGVL